MKIHIRKGLQNYLLVAFLALASMLEGLSGFVLWFALPHGLGGGGGQGWRAATRVVETFWGLNRTMWTDIHDWAAVALVVIAVAHIMMHWKWIVRMTQQVYRQVGELARRVQSGRAPETEKL
jgi:hypothetical protein